MIKSIRFQLWLSACLLILVLLGFFGFGYLARELLVQRLVEQTLADNRTIGVSSLRLFDQPLLIPQHTAGLRIMLQHTCNLIKLPNRGYICAVSPDGQVVAAPGLKPSDSLNMRESVFTDFDGKEYRFDEFFQLPDDFAGYHQDRPGAPLNVVVALPYPRLNIKLMVLQNHALLTARTERKLWELLPLMFGFSLAVAGTAYVLISKQVEKYQHTLHAKQQALQQALDTVADKHEQLLRKHEELAASHQEKDGLMEIVAHDLRSPLNKIKGLIDITRMTGKLSADQEQYIEMVLGIIEGANGLINDIMEMASLETGDFALHVQEADAWALLRDSVGSFAQAAEKKDLALSIDVPAGALTMATDVRVLHRILDNLISNALKFTPSGRAVWIRAWQEGAQVCIEVKDDGLGIREEEKPLLFRKFQKLSARPTNKESSSGLGLYIVKMLTEALQGQISVESGEGRGATFTLRLPQRLSL